MMTSHKVHDDQSTVLLESNNDSDSEDMLQSESRTEEMQKY